MAETVYKFFMCRFLEAWYQLSKEEQDALIAKLTEAHQKVGAKRTILCNTNWSSDQWLYAGVEEFPNIEAVQNFTVVLQELKWSRYCESTNLLGTKLEI